MNKTIILLIVAFVAFQGFATLSVHASLPEQRVLIKKPTPAECDADQDHNRVTVGDVYAVALAFGSKEGDSRWNPYADVNGDGVVRVDDMIAVIMNYGKSEI